MGKETGIEWTDHTWNPWIGCRPVSTGCANCYMYAAQRRYGMDPADVRRVRARTFEAPLGWKDPAKVFTCSWSDFFIEAADPWRDEAWEIMRRTPWLTYQILTKRPENIMDRLPGDWGDGWRNVWIGVTAEDQAAAETRIPVLLDVPAVIRFVSCEPLLEPVRLDHLIVSTAWGMCCVNALYGSIYDGVRWARGERLDWVICGGETGLGCRPMYQTWAFKLRNACVGHGVPFFFKQMGGPRKSSRKLGGSEWNEFPEVDPHPQPLSLEGRGEPERTEDLSLDLGDWSEKDFEETLV